MLLRILDRLEELIITSLMGAATLITFIAVAHRFLVDVPFLYPYLFQINLTWAQELCIYMFIWMAKFGAAYGVRTGIHVGVDVVINHLHGALQKRVIMFGLLSGALFVWRMMGTGQVSPDLEMPMWIVYLAVPLGSALMCYRFLQVAWRFRRTGELPSHNVAHVDGMEGAHT